MRILHVMKDCPYPPNGGYQADIWNRLVAMGRLGYRVHVVMTTRRTPPFDTNLAEVRKIAERVDLVPRELTAASVFTSQPSLVATNRNLKDLALDGEYDLALADSENLTPIFDNPRLRARLRVVRVHNDESRYYWTLAKAEERPHWKAFFAMEALRYRNYSLKTFGKADGIWFISKLEHDRIISKNPALRAKSCWIPPAIDLHTANARPVGASADGKRVLIVGGLANSLNREGIRWYIKKVHPALLSDPDYRLIVAGAARGVANAKAFAEKIAATDRCEVHVDLEDLGLLYEQARVIVNPMQHGGGVKLKTIHAVQQRLPLVTTSIGAEGCGFINRDHLRIEDDPKRFAQAVKEILDQPEQARLMAARAHQFLCEQYDQAEHIRSFMCARLASVA